MCGWAGVGFAGQYLSLRGHFIGSCAGVPGSWGENCFFDCIGLGCKISLILRDSAVETASLAEIEKNCHIAAGSFTAFSITGELHASSQLPRP
jgi:hypothetical protein